MTSDAAGPDRPMVAPEGLRFSGVLQDGTEQGQPGGSQPRLRGKSSTNPLVNGSFGSFDFAELLKAPPSVGELTIQDLLAANPDWADQAVVSAGEAERNLNGGAEVGPDGTSPLLRWTSDGSMMEELLKTFTPGIPTFQGNAASNPFSTLTKHPSFSTALMKDPSLSSAVFSALLSQNSEDPLSMLAALPPLNPVGSSAPGTPPSGQQHQGSTPLEAAEMQAPEQGYQGSAGEPPQERNASLTFPIGSQISRPNSTSDGGPSRGPSPAGLSVGQAHPQLSEGALAMGAELPRFSDELRYNMRPAQYPPEQAQNGSSQSGQAFVLGSRVVSLPPQVGRPGSAPVVRYGVTGPRVLFDAQREAGGSAAPHGEGRAQSLPNDFSRQAGGALHILDEAPSTSGRPSEPAYQAQQHPQEHYSSLASSYAFPVQSALAGQGSAIVQTPQRLGAQAGLPPIGGTRTQAGVQAQRMARTGATTALLPVLSRSGEGAQVERPRPDLQKPRLVTQPPTGIAAGPASSMLQAPPMHLRANGVPAGNLNAQPASAALLSAQPGLPTSPSTPAAKSQSQPLPLSSAGGLPLSAISQEAIQVPGLSSAPVGAVGTPAPVKAEIGTAAPPAARGPSSFLSGLMTGIQPVVSSTVPSVAPSSLAMPQVQAYVKPLPPLPSVPTIAEHYGALGPPRLPLASAGQGASYPPAHAPSALEVLPLVGTNTTLPQIPPLNLASQPLLMTRPVAGTAGLTSPVLQVLNPLPPVSISSAKRGLTTTAMPSYPGQRVTSASMARPASTVPLSAGGSALQQKGNPSRYITVSGPQGMPKAPTIFTKPTAAAAASKANGAIGMRSPAAAGASLAGGGAYSTSEATSSGSGGKAKRERGGQPPASTAKRSAISSASFDGHPPQHPRTIEDDEGGSMDDANADSMERSLRRAIRKEKNRASAAASRARREAYTASLEEQVKRLKANQEWLQLQLREQSGDVDMTPVIPNRPKRQLSL